MCCVCMCVRGVCMEVVCVLYVYVGEGCVYGGGVFVLCV